ncbi:hypothetical protein M9H77_34296 [Catharanthus roseus]|uniref:Uncharacterized protein n=1 Tax=Catharanthus roseus TaxID=4058 RepID=A0ACB9ZKR1_CATRO|nr:hypothetical protein M9H77_34296 [Catharanthus roseus]
MIDVCANSGWLSSAITCMHLLQMVMQGLWCDRDSSLRMLPCMTEDLVSSLNRRGILKVPQLLDVPFATLQALTDNSTASRLQQELQYFPRMRVQLKVQRRDSDGDEGLRLNIRLERSNSGHRTSRAFVPRFPKVKDEAWWLVLGSSSTAELHALKRVSFSDRLLTHLDIPSTANLKGMKVILVSDCYIGFEQEYNIEEFA